MHLLFKLRDFGARYLHATPRVVYAFTAGLASRRGRHLVAEIADQLGYTAHPPTLERVDATALVDERLPVVVREAIGQNGNVSVYELLVLAQLVRTRAPRRLFEFGTFDGRTTLALAANAPDGARVRTLDLPPTQSTSHELAPHERVYVDKPSSGARFQGTEEAARIEQLYGDSATFDYGPYPSDFVFVDGSHAYEYVLSDSRHALAMTGAGPAVIVWHDYGAWPGVTRALDELRDGDPAFAGLRHVRGTTLAVLQR